LLMNKVRPAIAHRALAHAMHAVVYLRRWRTLQLGSKERIIDPEPWPVR
jgi:hypothetical protein